MPQRIAIDYTAAVHQSAGIGRYVRELTAALLTAAAPPADFRLFVAGAHGIALPPPPTGAVYRPARLSERNFNRLWHRLHLPVPVELWAGPLDLYHAADFTLPPTLPRTRTVLTVYDLAYERFPDESMPGMQAYLSRAVPRSVRRADHVITISEAARADLVEIYGVAPEKISVAYPGVDARFTAQGTPGEADHVRRKYRLPDGSFVLTVGTLQPRKNHRRLVEAFARIESRASLVIAGGEGWAYHEVRQAVERLGLADRVIFTGYVADDDLPALYRSATAAAYPSLYEGFGLPVLEALACGTPALTSNVSSLPEAAGDAGLLVDPLDVEAVAAALDRLLSDADLRASLAEKGIDHARQFSWARAAGVTWDIYRRLLGI